MLTQSKTAATFAVSDVAPATTPIAEVPYRKAVESILQSRIESCPARLTRQLVPCEYHGFIGCLNAAFQDHRPLVLSPDHIWLLICQGFANHINANAESLRHRFVTFDGKETLVVRRDDFIKGAMENPWNEVFPEILRKMREFVGDNVDLLTPRFSTTGPVETAACQIVFMNALKTFFNYEVQTMCGIPQITLEGSPEDWQMILDQMSALEVFDLAWWTAPLRKVLQQFCDAAKGLVDRHWWQSFYKINNASGGPYVNGHLLAFFPYIADWQTKLPTTRMDFSETFSPFGGVPHSAFPLGVANVPFSWKISPYGIFRTEKAFDMEFIAGFVGISQDRKTLGLRPEIGWAVREKPAH